MGCKKGFTLVEMAIVLAIIGLLIGGVMAGRSLLRSAELKTITAEFSQYQRAINNFYDRYQELPGDMSRATEFWPTAANCPGTTTQGTTDGTTCAGDGDGKIDESSTSSNEEFRAWQHLSLAGLIEGIYEGVTGPDSVTVHSVPGFNVPASAFGNNTGWSVHTTPTATGNSSVFAITGGYGNLFVFGGQTSARTNGPVLTPAEAYKIDAKFDDGVPNNGAIFGRTWDDCTDATSASFANPVYLLSESNELCALMFPNAF